MNIYETISILKLLPTQGQQFTNEQENAREKAEEKIKTTLKDIIDKNKSDFERVGATAIQGSANKKNNE